MEMVSVFRQDTFYTADIDLKFVPTRLIERYFTYHGGGLWKCRQSINVCLSVVELV